MQSRLQNVELKANHIYREGNAVADAIANFKDYDNYIWWDQVPEFILQLFEKDRFMEFFRIG